jgi:hypothetical protein
MPPVLVLLLRHGERGDEAGLTRDSVDPFLTELGHQQASSAWHHILRGVNQKAPSPSSETPLPPTLPFLTFSSPLLRTLSTAAALSDHVPSPQIAILPGLCSCAAYVSHGGGFAGRALGIVGASEQAGNSLTSSAEFSLLSQKAVESASPSAQFLAAMEEAAVRADATPGRVAVAVTHREGMRDMKDLIEGAEGRLRLPYCAIAGIVAQVEGGRVAGWEWEGVWAAGEDVEAGVRASVERLRLVPKV